MEQRGNNISVVCVAPIDDTASCSQVLRPQQPPVQGVVLHEGGLAVRRSVYVPVVTNGQERLQGVLHHAGHRHGNQTVGLVVFKDVAPLAMQQQHNRLQETDRCIQSYNTGALLFEELFLSLSGVFFISMSFGENFALPNHLHLRCNLGFCLRTIDFSDNK